MSTITIAFDGIRYFLTAEGLEELPLPPSVIPYLERDEVLVPVLDEVGGLPMSNGMLHYTRQRLIEAAVASGAPLSQMSYGPLSNATESFISQLGVEDA